MNEALFSEIVMIDRSTPVRTPNPGHRNKSAPAPQSADNPARHDVFKRAFPKTLVNLNVAPTAKDDTELARLAGAMADLATDDSVVLRLKPDLPKNYRKTVETFLNTLVRVSGSLEENRLEEAISKLAM